MNGKMCNGFFWFNLPILEKIQIIVVDLLHCMRYAVATWWLSAYLCRANQIHKGYLFILKMHTLNATQQWFLPLLQPTHILHPHSNHHPSPSTHIHSSQWTKSAKHRSLTIEDEIDDNDMDPNLEEPLRAKLRQEPSRQGAQKEHLIFQP